MLYFKINDDEFVEVDQDTKQPKVFNKKEVLARKTAIETKIAAIPKSPSDKELLEWAKRNYPAVDHSREVMALQSELAEIQRQLDGASKLK